MLRIQEKTISGSSLTSRGRKWESHPKAVLTHSESRFKSSRKLYQHIQKADIKKTTIKKQVFYMAIYFLDAPPNILRVNAMLEHGYKFEW